VEQTENKGLVGRGHVPRPAEDMSKTFFYKGVRVIDASDDLHKYVSRAEIIETNDNGLTALKIE
ncbi:TPA: hypothetical protein HA265_03080, partial [Candidatus Woesearchaeota archaeon]|nr:hypothetical protein [Candidatus Woesearchaeota archaeon]